MSDHDNDLRKAIQKLACENPDARKHLVPILRRTARYDLSRTNWSGEVKGSKVRIRWNRDSLLIEELPGKPFKRKLKQTIFLLGRAMPGYDVPSAFIMDNLLRDAKFSSSMDHGKAVKAFEKALQEAKKVSKDIMPDWMAKAVDNLAETDDVFYLEVEPADSEPMTVEAKDFSVHAAWGRFKAYSPRGIDPQEGMGDFIQSKSPKSARKFFKMAKAKPDLLKRTSWSDFMKWLGDNKIAYDYVGSVWR